MLTFGSFFSGIGGFDLGFARAGMRCAYQVEKNAACRTLLQNKFGVPLYDDITTVGSGLEPVDLVCGGFPCQDVSVAGRRAGLAGKRSGLWFEFLRIIKLHSPRWVVIENVPGLLSSNEGRDMLAIVTGLAECGYRWGYRILNAQYFGVAQRRRRVFLVASLGSGRCAQVLFERESGAGDFEQGIEARRVSPPLTATGVGAGRTGNERNELDFCVPTMRANGDAHSGFTNADGIVPTLSTSMGHHGWSIGDQDIKHLQVARSQTTREGLRQNAVDETMIVAFQQNTRDEVRMIGGDGKHVGALAAQAGMKQQNFIAGMGVRRLTPTECTRLQGFPDSWLEVEYGNADEAHSHQVLHELWQSTYSGTGEGRRTAILTSLLTPEVLLAGVHGGWVSWQVAAQCAEARRALSSTDAWTEGLVRGLWQEARNGSSPYRRESFEQLAGELGRPLSGLSLAEAQNAEILLHSGMWQEAQAQWALRYSFTAGKARGSLGFSDSTRYKMLGNAIAVPCAEWLGRRISQTATGN